MRSLSLPLKKKDIISLNAGEKVLLTGVVYTARDQAHRRLVEAIAAHKKLPLPLQGSTIYYCGPNPAMPGRTIGACGPTTAGRMDDFTLPLLKKGLTAMIGKGQRAKKVRAAIKRHKCIYFLAVGGAGALLAQRVKKAKKIAYKDLGPEAVYKLDVVDFPVIVGIDAKGRDIFSGRSK